MSTNLDTERAIIRRSSGYPEAAADDIRWLTAETARLRDAAADEHKQRLTAEEASARALLDKTDAQAQVRQLGEIIQAQSAELAESGKETQRLLDVIADLRGEPVLRFGVGRTAEEGNCANDGAAVLDALTAAGWYRGHCPTCDCPDVPYEGPPGTGRLVVDGGELDTPVPLTDLRRASTEALLERHVGEPLRAISSEVMAEVAKRVTAVLVDLEHVRTGRATTHHDACWDEHVACLAARIRRTLTGEDA